VRERQRIRITILDLRQRAALSRRMADMAVTKAGAELLRSKARGYEERAASLDAHLRRSDLVEREL
jgi:hypothetical protein